ncbi:MAG: phospholipid carrier-dependent glycosyltransferase [Clostridia bacterium]|nr:phospholipid carrier-dependent glycosyltransferase [Clostridia bacterium]
MKKTACTLLALLILLLAGSVALADENLIENGDFSRMDGSLPAGWQKEMWYTDAGISLLTVEEDGYEGPCISVANVDENDARFAQTVSVEPDTLYRISAMVKAEGVDPDGLGATLSIGDIFVYSTGLYDTHGAWEYVELYGRTDSDQTSLRLFCRVGAYGTLARGRAWFDDVEMVKVEDVPAGAFVEDFFKDDSGFSGNVTTAEDGEPERYTQAWLLFACIYVLAVCAVVRKRGRIAERGNWPARLGLLLAAGLLLRIVVAMRVPGYYTDVSCFTGWSERIFETGIGRFYDPEYFCDYPPGYMLLLWPVALLRRIFSLPTGTPAYRALLKIWPMLADGAAAWLIWRRARRSLGERAAFLLAAFYALNPAVIANSAAWGQIDGLLTLLIAMCALSAVEYRYIRALLWFAAALLVKPQALLFAPLGLAAMLFGLIRLRADRPEDFKRCAARFGLGVLACLGAMYAVAFAFCVSQAHGVLDALTRPAAWLFGLYRDTMQGYRYMTVNTLNLYQLLGLNWAHVEDHASLFALAWALFALSYAGTVYLCWRSARQPHRLLLLGGTLILLISTFGPMMHERYVFPAMLLLILAYTLDRDWRILAGLVALTATLFLNEVLVLQGGMTAANYGHLQSQEAWLNGPMSLVAVLNAGFLLYTAIDICVRGHVISLPQPEDEHADEAVVAKDLLPEASGFRMHLKRADYLVMAVVTLAYSIVAFLNLGVTNAPQTGWTSSVSGESVVFDLGDVERFRMTYYGGICNSTFTVALSNDGENWSNEVYARYAQGEIFRWLWFVPLDEDLNTLYADEAPAENDEAPPIAYASSAESEPRQTARYVRITAQSAGLNLWEVAFLGEDDRPLPIAEVRQYGQTPGSDSDAHLLTDEQSTVPAYPSYLNSTYFDEIYHARTAYEQLHGMNVYEWTHPPLGKVWMMLGVKLFGMTPFGWRSMGALVGALMLPLMYLLARQLTKDSRLSTIAMCLMALDSMHFTQTRIATIDSYAVFWIMLMYLFMFRYCQMSWTKGSFKATLVPLGLCGVTMGIAWATKWIGIYASAGLAVLFFWTLCCHIREGLSAQDRRGTLKRTIVTLLFCVAFFVIVPVLIYYFSYYWHLKGEGLSGFAGMFSMARVRRVVEIQKNIFDYHAGLGGDTHYFRSPWYQWPVIWWPMWYYSGTGYLPDADSISSISCMGNPAVWWFGLAALIYIIVRTCLDRRASRLHVMVIIGFASQFLPWVIVPRSTFIYHYFASVPFIILASVLLLDAVRRRSPVAYRVTSCVLLASAAALFAAFYPLESGLPCPRSYARYLRWFRWYNY